MEETIPDPRIHDQTVEDVRHPVPDQLKEAGTKRARTKLADSDGYSYNLQVRRTNVTYWQCTVRPTGNHCKATVIQRGDGLQQGKHGHNRHREPEHCIGKVNENKNMFVTCAPVSF